MAGYQLSFDLVPEEYHLTKPLVNNGINDSSAQLEGTYGISKTYNGIYGGSAQEENEGYIIAAAATKSSSMNVVDGYDLVVGRTLEGIQYRLYT